MPSKTHGGSKKGQWTRKRAAKKLTHLIEESDVSFSKPIDSNMPEDNPLHHHLNKILHDFRNLSDAVDTLKSSPTIEKSCFARINTCLDTFSDTLGEMETFQPNL